MCLKGKAEGCWNKWDAQKRWMNQHGVSCSKTHAQNKCSSPHLCWAEQDTKPQKWSRETGNFSKVKVLPGWRKHTKREKKELNEFLPQFLFPESSLPALTGTTGVSGAGWFKGLSLDSRFAPVDFAYGASCRRTDIIACQILLPGWQSIFLLDENASSHMDGAGLLPSCPTHFPPTFSPIVQVCGRRLLLENWGSLIFTQHEIWEGILLGVSEPQESQGPTALGLLISMEEGEVLGSCQPRPRLLPSWFPAKSRQDLPDVCC